MSDPKDICSKLDSKDKINLCRNLIEDQCINSGGESQEIIIKYPGLDETVKANGIEDCADYVFNLVDYYGIKEPYTSSAQSGDESVSDQDEQVGDSAHAKPWGLFVSYSPRLPIRTSVSEGGLGHEATLSYTREDDAIDRYSVQLSTSWGTTKGKIVPEADVAGTYTENKHFAIMLGLGHEKRLIQDSGLFSLSAPLLGIGESSTSQKDRVVGGEEFSFPQESTTTFDISTQYGFGVELKSSDNIPAFRLTPMMRVGVLYNPDDSQWNRLNLETGVILTFGGYNSAQSDNRVNKPSPMGIAFYTYGKIHSAVQTFLMNKVLADNADKIADSGLLTGNEEPGSLEDLRILEGGSALFGSMGMTNTREFFLSAGDLNALPLALEAGSGFLLTAVSSNNAGRGTGIGTILNAGSMVVYMIMEVDKPLQRKNLENSPNALQKAALISYGINSLVFLFGALAVASDPSEDFGIALLSGGAQANFALAMSPDPTNSGALDLTTYTFIPATYYEGSFSGSRGGFLLTKDFSDSVWFSEARFLSHALRPDNILKRTGTEPEEPYGDTILPTEVSATIGVQYKSSPVRLALGFDTLMQYGSGLGATAGFGGSAALDFVVPFGENKRSSGLTLGVRAAAHKLVPEGEQFEIIPHIGALVKF